MITHEKYDEAKYMLQQFKVRVIEEIARKEQEKLAWEEAWPFDD